MNKHLLLIHPLLWATAPILSLWAENAENVRASQVTGVMLVALAAGLLLTAGCALLARSLHRGAAIATCCLILFFNYGRAFALLVGKGIFEDHTRCNVFLAVCSLIVLCLAVALIFKFRRKEQELSRVLTIAGTVMVAFAVFKLPFRDVLQVRAKEHAGSLHPMLDTTQPRPASHATADDPSKPDVYYIILDGYARQDVLQTVYGFDNSEFIGWLRERGFYVADDSTANYPMTHLSMGSSLNLDYLDPLIQRLPDESISEVPYYELIRNPLLGRIFQSHGYRYIHFSTNFRGTEDSDIADEIVRYHPQWLQNEFMEVLLGTTAARSFGTHIADVHLDSFRVLGEIPDRKGPTFSLAHFILPHHPYVFDRDGNVLNNVLLDMSFKHCTGYWYSKEAYVEQLIFANKMTQRAIEDILSKSVTPPIIVLQSDHGSASLVGGNLARLQYREPFLRERFPILNAYYVPPEVKTNLYASITPVNSFRLICNKLFKADYAPLPDRNFHTWYNLGNRMIEVTESVRKGAPSAEDVSALARQDLSAKVGDSDAGRLSNNSHAHN